MLNWTWAGRRERRGLFSSFPIRLVVGCALLQYRGLPRLHWAHGHFSHNALVKVMFVPGSRSKVDSCAQARHLLTTACWYSGAGLFF